MLLHEPKAHMLVCDPDGKKSPRSAASNGHVEGAQELVNLSSSGQMRTWTRVAMWCCCLLHRAAALSSSSGYLGMSCSRSRCTRCDCSSCLNTTLPRVQ
eukprot:364189-Chlamydomonas_euryale.AAC.7